MYSPLDTKTIRRLKKLDEGRFVWLNDHLLFGREQNITESFDAVITEGAKKFYTYSGDDSEFESMDTLYTEFYLYD